MTNPRPPISLAPAPADRPRARGTAASLAAAAPEVRAARAFTVEATSGLQASRAFQQLPEATRSSILRDLGKIGSTLGPATRVSARALDLPPFGHSAPAPEPAPPAGGASEDGQPPAGPRQAATESIARRAGALSDEVDFPDFVAGLVHGTFDAIVDASIRQMESFADLVSAVAKTAEDFTEENVTPNQARDWLLQQYPKDLALDRTEGLRLQPVPPVGSDTGEPFSPAWLADFGLEGEELTPDLIEEELVPKARAKVGQNRLQTLATMVLLGMNRVVVRDGSISARLRFRATAADHAKVDYAVSDDPSSGGNWGARGSPTYALPSTKVSTVGVNVQADADLRAELFGEVKINFASETLPLDRFVDEARRTLLERHARPANAAPAGASAPTAGAAPAALAPAAPAPVPAAPIPPAPAGATAP